MNYKIQEIEGIGPSFRRTLAVVGVDTTADLLSRAATPRGRTKLTEETGIRTAQILRWCNQADLMRVKGIGRQYAELLEAAGVDTVKELRNRNAENLANTLTAVNETKKLSRTTPFASQIADWIVHAKELKPLIEY
jgi:predicted flap endonuclease-1-like 5' DNA nuclease